MAIHRRVYRPLGGVGLTPAWSRFLVLPRYAWQSITESKLLSAYLMLCLVPPLFAAVIIYFYNNPVAQALVSFNADWPFQIDGQFFYYLLVAQGSLGFLLTAWMGPGLVSPDLVNGALPLYLSRPFSRLEYVLGRLATLFFVLSLITWVPGVLLFGLQAALDDRGWGIGHLPLLGGIVLAAWLWILVMSLVALALSAWVKWRIVATGLFAGTFLLSAGLGAAANEALRTYWGGMVSIFYLVSTIWRDLLDVPLARSVRRHEIGDARTLDIPVGWCWLALLGLGLLCVLLLDRRLRGREVVR
jgi:ABC-2 type transport system permease protein